MDLAAKNPPSREREQIESRDPNARHSWSESSVQDLKVAFRSLRKSPGFAITAILTLALGIGVNASIFQLMDAVRLRTLPVADPDRLASVEIRGGIHDFIPVRPSDLSFPLWEQVRDHQQAFSSVFAWRTNHVRIGQGIDERKAVALWFTGEAFNTLGISPEKGRFFSPEEDKPGCGIPGTVISHAFWQSQFGGQDSAIGSTILIERKPTRVLGVTPAGFLGLEIGRTFDFALPICSTPTYHDDLPFFTRPDYFFLNVIGRLKFSWTLARASAQLESVSPGIIAATLPTGYSNAFLDIYKRYRLNAYPAGHGVTSLDTYDSSLWLLLGITSLVLLIACANLANLMLVRGKWMLAATCDADEAPAYVPVDVRGIDFGVVNIVVDDLGRTHSGAQIDDVRRRQHSRRRALQKVGTRSAKRALRRASGKQARFQRHTNHVLSKAIVLDAERGRSAVAIEDLEGIRNRVKANRRQRRRLHNWGFHELRALIEYKARMRGVPVDLVDPRNTSRQCSCCGLIDKRNRPSRDQFKCIGCGVAAPADHNAALNIRQRALTARGMVVPPQVAIWLSGCVSHEESRLL